MIIVDRRDRQLAEDRGDVHLQRLRPLPSIPLASPGGALVRHVGIPTTIEAPLIDRLDGNLLSTGAVAVLDRVNALQEQQSGLAGILTGLGERDGVRRSEPHLPHAAVQRVAEYPRPAHAAVSFRCDLKIEPAAVIVHSWAGGLDVLAERRSIMYVAPHLHDSLDWCGR